MLSRTCARHERRTPRERSDKGLITVTPQQFVVAEGLTPPNEAKLVRASKNGGAPVTDGIFPETKEFLVGYWVIDVDTPERAYEVAAKASSAPGPGGAPLNMAIEVRPVMQAPLPGT